MAITIVSQIQSPQTAAPDTATPGASAEANSGGFADILTGQQRMAALGSNVSQALEGLAKDGKVSDGAEPADDTKDTAEADTGSLLAALGLVTPQVQTTAPLPSASITATTAQAAGQGQAVAGATATPLSLANEAVKPLSTEQESSPAQGMTGATENPAKFAVPVPELSIADSTDKAASTAKDETSVLTALPVAQNHIASTRSDAPLSIETNIRAQNWQSDFTQKVVWLANNDKQSAQITLNPPQMGPIEVSLKLENGNASASFVAANQEVRDAIETAMPRLREMFASAGIDLGQTNVSAQSFSQQQAQYENRPSDSSRFQGDNDILAGTTSGTLSTRAFSGRSANGLVDLFA